MDRATITELLDRTRYLDQTGQLKHALAAYIGDDANAFATLGLTINQGAADNEILALKSSDVAHGMTSLTETDTFATVGKKSATAGGVQIVGYSEGSGAVSIIGRHTSDDNAKSTASVGNISLESLLKTGTTTTTAGADANLVTIGDGSATRFIFDTEGSGHADVAWTTF